MSVLAEIGVSDVLPIDKLLAEDPQFIETIVQLFYANNIKQMEMQLHQKDFEDYEIEEIQREFSNDSSMEDILLGLYIPKIPTNIKKNIANDLQTKETTLKLFPSEIPTKKRSFLYNYLKEAKLETEELLNNIANKMQTGFTAKDIEEIDNLMTKLKHNEKYYGPYNKYRQIEQQYGVWIAINKDITTIRDLLKSGKYIPVKDIQANIATIERAVNTTRVGMSLLQNIKQLFGKWKTHAPLKPLDPSDPSILYTIPYIKSATEPKPQITQIVKAIEPPYIPTSKPYTQQPPLVFLQTVITPQLNIFKHELAKNRINESIETVHKIYKIIQDQKYNDVKISSIISLYFQQYAQQLLTTLKDSVYKDLQELNDSSRKNVIIGIQNITYLVNKLINLTVYSDLLGILGSELSTYTLDINDHWKQKRSQHQIEKKKKDIHEAELAIKDKAKEKIRKDKIRADFKRLGGPNAQQEVVSHPIPPAIPPVADSMILTELLQSLRDVQENARPFPRSSEIEEKSTDVSDSMFLAKLLQSLRDVGEDTPTYNNEPLNEEDVVEKELYSPSDSMFLAKLLQSLRDVSEDTPTYNNEPLNEEDVVEKELYSPSHHGYSRSPGHYPVQEESEEQELGEEKSDEQAPSEEASEEKELYSPSHPGYSRSPRHYPVQEESEEQELGEEKSDEQAPSEEASEEQELGEEEYEEQERGEEEIVKVSAVKEKVIEDEDKEKLSEGQEISAYRGITALTDYIYKEQETLRDQPWNIKPNARCYTQKYNGVKESRLIPGRCAVTGDLQYLFEIIVGNKIFPKLCKLIHNTNQPQEVSDVLLAKDIPNTLLGMDVLLFYNFRLSHCMRETVNHILGKNVKGNLFLKEYLRSSLLGYGALFLLPLIMNNNVSIIVAHNGKLFPGIIGGDENSYLIVNKYDSNKWELLLTDNFDIYFTKMQVNSMVVVPKAELSILHVLPELTTRTWWAQTENQLALSKQINPKNIEAFYCGFGYVEENITIADILWSNLSADTVFRSIEWTMPNCKDKNTSLKIKSTFFKAYINILAQVLPLFGLDLVNGDIIATPVIIAQPMIAPLRVFTAMYTILSPKYEGFFDVVIRYLQPETNIEVWKTFTDKQCTLKPVMSNILIDNQEISRLIPEFDRYRLSALKTKMFNCLPNTNTFALTSKIMMFILIYSVLPFMKWPKAYYWDDFLILDLIPHSLINNTLTLTEPKSLYYNNQTLEHLFATPIVQLQVNSSIWIVPLTVRQENTFFYRVLLVFHVQKHGGWLEFYDTCNNDRVKRYVQASLALAWNNRHKSYNVFEFNNYPFISMIQPDSYLSLGSCYLAGKAKESECADNLYLYVCLSVQNTSIQDANCLVQYLNFSTFGLDHPAKQIVRELFVSATEIIQKYEKTARDFLQSQYAGLMLALTTDYNIFQSKIHTLQAIDNNQPFGDIEPNLGFPLELIENIKAVHITSEKIKLAKQRQQERKQRNRITRAHLYK